ncbi:hypothetical protein BJ742DRAFT_788093 [Cladochytrium replicatum]|nr:hypothetical protein BJ742DRAFT_788093 [Cladochytrium replicatum]
MDQRSATTKQADAPASPSPEPELHVRRDLKNPVAAQAYQLEKLMARIDRPVEIPQVKEQTIKPPTDFVRNVQGSSAGAGSGEFHVYRALRRKENARLKFLEEMTKEERERHEFEQKQLEIQKSLEEKTAKRREKRKKRKQRDQGRKKTKKDGVGEPSNEGGEDDNGESGKDDDDQGKESDKDATGDRT